MVKEIEVRSSEVIRVFRSELILRTSTEKASSHGTENGRLTQRSRDQITALNRLWKP